MEDQHPINNESGNRLNNKNSCGCSGGLGEWGNKQLQEIQIT